MGHAIAFTKGHGTENDFVLVPDLEGERELTGRVTRWLADRHAGVGGDGVIRVVPTASVPEVAGQAAQAPWFMDYRNADGSLAEMCGNGVRVFATYLLREGLVPAPDGAPAAFAVASRAGVKPVRVEVDGSISVDLGAWSVVGGPDAIAAGSDVRVSIADVPGPLPGLSLDLGNPHVVVALPSRDHLDLADLTTAPTVDPIPAHGTNVELVVPLGPSHIRMRVHERGVGETRSCGTGVAAAALACRVWGGAAAPDVWRVDVPGGTLQVTARADGHVELRGPAVLVADGTVQVPDDLFSE